MKQCITCMCILKLIQVICRVCGETATCQAVKATYLVQKKKKKKKTQDTVQTQTKFQWQNALTVHPYFNAIPCSVSVCCRLWRIRYSLFRTWLQVLPYFFNCRAESRMDCRSLNNLSLSIATMSATYALTVTSHHLKLNYLCITQPTHDVRIEAKPTNQPKKK